MLANDSKNIKRNGNSQNKNRSMTTKYLTKYNITYLKQIEADVQIANMTEDQVQTEINEVRNINLTGNENEESSSYIKN